MQQLLRELSSDEFVLDLGSNKGSFSHQSTLATILRIDLEQSQPSRENTISVRGDAAHLPLKDGLCSAVIANHSLEHMAELEKVLPEIGRVIRRADGRLFVSVPDASTLTDRVYRWLSGGGGHVNPFVDARDLAQQIQKQTGLKLQGIVTLYSGLSFLNSRNITQRRSGKMALFFGGNESFLRWIAFGSRLADRAFQTRFSVYGWALYFGAPVTLPSPAPNVCIRCGAGHAMQWLIEQNATYKSGPFPMYRCPACSAPNFLIDEGWTRS
jgi:SAM-dependent methyltransferase